MGVGVSLGGRLGVASNGSVAVGGEAVSAGPTAAQAVRTTDNKARATIFFLIRIIL
jgi:hypothetical protein